MFHTHSHDVTNIHGLFAYQRKMMKPTFDGNIAFKGIIFQKDRRALYMPMLEAVVMNMLDQDIGVNERFLVDTGAAVSILRGAYEKLFTHARQVDMMKIQYGSGDIKHLPVYQAKLKVKRIEAMSLKVALDNDLKTNSLLGNVDFLERFRKVAIGNHTKKVHFFF